MSVSSRWPRRSFRSYPLAMEVGTQTWKGSVGNVSVLFFIHERTWWSLIKLNSVIFPTLLSNLSTLVIITEYKIGSLFLPICSQIKILMLSAQVKRYLFFRGFISFCWSSTYRDQIDFFVLVQKLLTYFVFANTQFIGKIGVVRDFTANGDVVVEYPDRRWRYNPAALSKVLK